MPTVRSPAVVLHAFPYGDTSRILRLLTPDYGLRSLIAKGARSPRSRFGGVLDPFTQGEVLFNLREGRELLTLSGFSLLRSRQGIGRDLAAFTGASLLAEIAIRVGTEEPNPELFYFLSDAFDALNAPSASPAVTALGAIWSLIGLVGFQPELDRCVRCGRILDAAEPARFDVEGGGVVCTSCRPAGRLLQPVVRQEVRRLLHGDLASVESRNLPVHSALLDAFLPVHLSPDRGLRSLAMFREELK